MCIDRGESTFAEVAKSIKVDIMSCSPATEEYENWSLFFGCIAGLDHWTQPAHSFNRRCIFSPLAILSVCLSELPRISFEFKLQRRGSKRFWYKVVWCFQISWDQSRKWYSSNRIISKWHGVVYRNDVLKGISRRALPLKVGQRWDDWNQFEHVFSSSAKRFSRDPYSSKSCVARPRKRAPTGG